WGKFEPKRYVQNKTWKLYENGELYHLKEDPSEQNPLSVEEQPSEVKQLVYQFKKVLKEYQ
ncbi:MAG: arylsulfatase, partial [Allomuricauda sp.]